jgi:hypothetical protein
MFGVRRQELLSLHCQGRRGLPRSRLVSKLHPAEGACDLFLLLAYSPSDLCSRNRPWKFENRYSTAEVQLSWSERHRLVRCGVNADWRKALFASSALLQGTRALPWLSSWYPPFGFLPVRSAVTIPPRISTLHRNERVKQALRGHSLLRRFISGGAAQKLFQFETTVVAR